MKKIIGCLIAVLLMMAVPAHAFVIEGFSHPESITKSGSSFFVSDIGTKLDAKALDGDGVITKLDGNGKVLVKPFNKTMLNSPKGLLVVDDTLYVADCDRVVGLDLTTGKEKTVIDFSSEGTLYLNALALRDKNRIFVSATDIGKVFEITLGAKPTYKLVADNLGGPNGMVWNAKQKRLYVVEWGTGKPNGNAGYLDLSRSTVVFKKLSDYHGYLDGAVLNGDNLIFSNWVDFKKVGILKSMDLKSGTIKDVPLPELVAGPADFYQTADGTLWIPMMIEGKVLVTK